MAVEMNEREIVDKYIDNFINLQRIKNSLDKDKEIEYQISVVKAKLESFGIITTDLEMKP